MGRKVRYFRNRQKTSVTPLKIFAPELGIVKRIRTAFVLGETKAIVIEGNVYRSYRFSIANRMPTARKILFWHFFPEKNKTNKLINHFALDISSVYVLQQVAIKKKILFLFRDIVQYLLTDIRYRDLLSIYRY